MAYKKLQKSSVITAPASGILQAPRPFSEGKLADVAQDVPQQDIQRSPSDSNCLGRISIYPPNFEEPILQPKLTIGAANDPYEKEADQVAHQVVTKIHSAAFRTPQPQGNESIQRQMGPRIAVMRKPTAQGQAATATPDLEASIQAARGSGHPIKPRIRELMEQVFESDFSRVRIHTDAQSDQLNRSIQARAFTTGQDIFFRQGEYNPDSEEGQELIAHELTHVVQQTGQIRRQTVPRGSCSGTDCLMRTEPGDLTFAGIEAGRLAAELNFLAQHPPNIEPGQAQIQDLGTLTRFADLVNQGLIVFDAQLGGFRGNLRGFEWFQNLMQQEDFARAFGVALAERADQLEADSLLNTFIYTPLEIVGTILTVAFITRIFAFVSRFAMYPATARLLAADAELTAQAELASEAALARTATTAMNARGVEGVTRTMTRATGEETFIHTTMRAPAPHTAESAALSIQESQSIRLSQGGISGQWGEGVYAYEGTLATATGRQTIVQFQVPAGTAIERITIPGQRTIIRLVPAEGMTLSVVRPATNLTPAQIREAAEWLRAMRGITGR